MQGSAFRLFIDEDAMDDELVSARLHKNIAATTAQLAGRRRKSDEDQLIFATQQDAALHTFNIGHFHRIHSQWVGAGREHADIVLARQQRYSIGEQVRRILLIRAALTDIAMRNRAEFLANWD